MGFQVNPTKDRILMIAKLGSKNNRVIHCFDHWFLVEGDCYKDRV